MIKSLDIRNFQSLEKVQLTLAPFTVIVGQSSSGKSALVRSLAALTSNRRGTEFISHGKTTSVITAEVDAGIVSLSRSSVVSKNKYTIIPEGAEPQVFTKLGGDVPPEVSTALRLVPKDPVSVAQQFDRPFLLADSPAQAAQTLGAITNVHVIFDAAREANRRRLNGTQTLKTRTSDLESVNVKLAELDYLDTVVEFLGKAEKALAQAQEIDTKRNRLIHLVNVLRDTKHAVTEAQAKLSVSAPDIQPFLDVAARRDRLASLVAQLRASVSDFKAKSELVSELEKEAEALSVSYNETLQGLGQCPTCGQSV